MACKRTTQHLCADTATSRTIKGVEAEVPDSAASLCATLVFGLLHLANVFCVCVCVFLFCEKSVSCFEAAH